MCELSKNMRMEDQLARANQTLSDFLSLFLSLDTWGIVVVIACSEEYLQVTSMPTTPSNVSSRQTNDDDDDDAVTSGE
ncbi:hypothetical protein ACLKA6_009142 [Drosophila palustris]